MRGVAVSLLCAMTAAPAAAADWSAQAGSRLGFAASYQGEKFEGRFQRFTSRIRFDPSRPGDCRFDVVIALASADTRNSERDELLQGPDFFDSRARPEARYLAATCRALGPGRYVADGKLSLRDVTRPVALEFRWSEGARPTLDGKTRLRRLQFAVGGGDWGDTGLIPDEVEVTTHLVLAPTATAAPPRP